MTEGFPQQLLLGRVGQMLFGANDVADTHGDVVDHVGQEEHDRAVTAQQDEVFDDVVIEHGLTTDEVNHGGGTGARHLEAQRSPWRRFQAAVAAEAVVSLVLPHSRPHHFLRAVAVIGVALLEQPRRCQGMLGRIFALEMGALIGARGDTDPGESGDDAVGPFLPVAFGVGVFNTQHEHAAHLLGDEGVVQRGSGATNVEVAGGGRGEANSKGSVSSHTAHVTQGVRESSDRHLRQVTNGTKPPIGWPL